MNNMMWSIFNYIDLFLFLYFLLCVVAIVVHVISSRKSNNMRLPVDGVKIYRYAIIVNALSFDLKHSNCLSKLTEQDYDHNMYDIFLIKDSSESYSIDAIIEKINDSSKDYKNLILLDIEDIIPTSFITRMNVAYNLSGTAIQAHNIDTTRTDKETLHTSIKDEVYRQLYQNGRSSLGLSSRVETNGILLNIKWLKKNRDLFQNPSQTDLYLAARDQYIVFLNDLYIDSNTRNLSDRHKKQEEKDNKSISQKNKVNYFKAIRCNQINLTSDLAIPLLMSSFIPPLRLLWISITSITIVTMFLGLYFCLKWIILLLILTFFIMVTIPDKLVTKHFDKAVLKLLFNYHSNKY